MDITTALRNKPRKRATMVERTGLSDEAFDRLVERVLSGPGLVNLYQAIARVDRVPLPQRDTAEIVSAALAGECEISHEALELFCAFLGSVAGNVALTLGARGGLFIGGGISARFPEFLSASSFRERFEAKGRMSDYLARIPTAIIVRPDPAFLGLAAIARRSFKT